MALVCSFAFSSAAYQQKKLHNIKLNGHATLLFECDVPFLLFSQILETFQVMRTTTAATATRTRPFILYTFDKLGALPLEPSSPDFPRKVDFLDMFVLP